MWILNVYRDVLQGYKYIYYAADNNHINVASCMSADEAKYIA